MKMRLSLFIFLLSLYILTTGGHVYTSDDTTMYYVARSIVEEGNTDVPLNEQTQGLVTVRHGADNKRYSVYPLLQPLLAVPFFVGGQILASFFPPQFYEFLTRFAVSFFNPVILALTAVVLFSLLLHFYSRKTALVVALLFGLGTVAWPHAQTFLSEPLTTLLLLLAFSLGVVFKHQGHWRFVLFSGFFFGLAVVAKMVSLFAIPAFFVYFLLEEDRKGRLHVSREALKAWLLFGLAAIPPVFVNQIYNYSLFGTFLSSGYEEGALHGLTLSQPWYLGLLGLLLSPGRRIFVYSPPLLLTLFAMRPFFRKHRVESLFLLCFVLAFLGFFSSVSFWHGENSWGPRYLYYILPFFMVLAGYAVQRLVSMRGGKLWLALFFALSIFIQILGTSLMFSYYIDFVVRPQIPFEEANRPHQATFLYTMHFSPSSSPIVGHLLLLPEIAKNTFVLGGVPPMPLDPQGLYAWYWSPALDVWWVWWYYSGLPKVFLALLLIPFSYILLSGYRLYRIAGRLEPCFNIALFIGLL